MKTANKVHIKRIETANEISAVMSKIPDMVERLRKRTDPEERYEKLAKYAENFVLFSDGEACAYAAIYANDIQNKIAYITFIGCVPEKRRMGYGQIIYDHICDHARSVGMIILRLEVAFNNEKAISFYKKNGMYEVGKTEYGFIMEKKL